MKTTLLLLLIHMTFSAARAQDEDILSHTEQEFSAVVPEWFAAWELICRDIYHIHAVQPVEFVFFDEKHVYTSAAIPGRFTIPVKGPDLMNLSLTWYRYEHGGSISLPGGSSIPVGLTPFAAKNDQVPDTPYFVMPLPSFWQKAGVKSQELGLKNMVTGVFIHEFSHTQQMQNFGQRISHYDTLIISGHQFDDNIIQSLFGNDSCYTRIFLREVITFYAAAGPGEIDRGKLEEAFLLMQERQAAFFTEQAEVYKDIENLFLTMEGFGQYSMYLWLIHPEGGRTDQKTAIAGVRRNKKWWSQDQGFALFLILEKLSPPDQWAGFMMGSDQVTPVTDLIRSHL